MLLAAQPDVLVVAAYGLILPQWVLDLPRWGCLNIHASLLPRWRGAAPIHRAIEAGDTETGITLMQMDAGLDTGDMLAVQHEAIRTTDTTGSLHDRLAAMGARMLVTALAQMPTEGRLKGVRQPEAGVSYAHKVEKHEAVVDWKQPAERIARRIRAFNPFPGATTTIQGETVKLWDANSSQAESGNLAAAGTLLSADSDGIAVRAATGVVNITQLQRPGGKRLGAGEFLRGFPLASGIRLGAD